MANANISIVNLVNTFDEWRTATNVLIQDRNILRNHAYVKDESDFIMANGAITLARTTNGTLLTLLGYANAYIGGDTSTGNLTVRSNATIGNLTVTGKQTNLGDVVNDSNTIVLRASASTDGIGTIRVHRGVAGKNAEIYFNNTANVWQTNFDTSTQTYKTLLTTANVVDSTSSTSTIDAASPNSVKTAYDYAGTVGATSANTARVSANGGSILSARGLNFVNTATVTVSVIDGVGAAAGNANISFTAVGGGGLTNFPVTRGNSPATTVAAQGITFNNTATIGVTVVAGSPNSNANVSFEYIGGGGTIQGIQGIQGVQGILGVQGRIGSQGLAGIQGSVGTQGVVGAQGIAGTQGATGTQGLQGIQGLTGIAGTQYLHHVTTGYTSSAKVHVRSSAPPAGNTQGDIWIDTAGTEGFDQSLSPNGYTKLPNGLIMQWGYYEHPSTFVSGVTGEAVVFPTTFPTAFLNATATAIGIDGNSDCWAEITWQSPTTTGMTVRIQTTRAGATTKGFYWTAVGY
jgi:hypothetical protein